DVLALQPVMKQARGEAGRLDDEVEFARAAGNRPLQLTRGVRGEGEGDHRFGVRRNAPDHRTGDRPTVRQNVQRQLVVTAEHQLDVRLRSIIRDAHLDHFARSLVERLPVDFVRAGRQTVDDERPARRLRLHELPRLATHRDERVDRLVIAVHHAPRKVRERYSDLQRRLAIGIAPEADLLELPVDHQRRRLDMEAPRSVQRAREEAAESPAVIRVDGDRGRAAVETQLGGTESLVAELYLTTDRRDGDDDVALGRSAGLQLFVQPGMVLVIEDDDANGL